MEDVKNNSMKDNDDNASSSAVPMADAVEPVSSSSSDKDPEQTESEPDENGDDTEQDEDDNNEEENDDDTEDDDDDENDKTDTLEQKLKETTGEKPKPEKSSLKKMVIEVNSGSSSDDDDDDENPVPPPPNSDAEDDEETEIKVKVEPMDKSSTAAAVVVVVPTTTKPPLLPPSDDSDDSSGDDSDGDTLICELPTKKKLFNTPHEYLVHHLPEVVKQLFSRRQIAIEELRQIELTHKKLTAAAENICTALTNHSSPSAEEKADWKSKHSKIKTLAFKWAENANDEKKQTEIYQQIETLVKSLLPYGQLKQKEIDSHNAATDYWNVSVENGLKKVRLLNESITKHKRALKQARRITSQQQKDIHLSDAQKATRILLQREAWNAVLLDLGRLCVRASKLQYDNALLSWTTSTSTTSSRKESDYAYRDSIVPNVLLSLSPLVTKYDGVYEAELPELAAVDYAVKIKKIAQLAVRQPLYESFLNLKDSLVDDCIHGRWFIERIRLCVDHKEGTPAPRTNVPSVFPQQEPRLLTLEFFLRQVAAAFASQETSNSLRVWFDTLRDRDSKNKLTLSSSDRRKQDLYQFAVFFGVHHGLQHTTFGSTEAALAPVIERVLYEKGGRNVLNELGKRQKTADKQIRKREKESTHDAREKLHAKVVAERQEARKKKEEEATKKQSEEQAREALSLICPFVAFSSSVSSAVRKATIVPATSPLFVMINVLTRHLPGRTLSPVEPSNGSELHFTDQKDKGKDYVFFASSPSSEICFYNEKGFPRDIAELGDHPIQRLVYDFNGGNECLTGVQLVNGEVFWMTSTMPPSTSRRKKLVAGGIVPIKLEYRSSKKTKVATSSSTPLPSTVTTTVQMTMTTTTQPLPSPPPPITERKMQKRVRVDTINDDALLPPAKRLHTSPASSAVVAPAAAVTTTTTTTTTAIISSSSSLTNGSLTHPIVFDDY